jgi:hypothetical protein
MRRARKRLLRKTAFREDVQRHAGALLRPTPARQNNTKACARGLIHLPIDQRNFGFAQIVRLDDARFAHLVVEVVAFAHAFADACEDRYAAVELGNIVDQLHDDDRLAHSSAAESSHFAALQKWADQINHFDSGGEHLLRSRLVRERRRRTMDWIILIRFHRAFIHRIAGDIEDAESVILCFACQLAEPTVNGLTAYPLLGTVSAARRGPPGFILTTSGRLTLIVAILDSQPI